MREAEQPSKLVSMTETANPWDRLPNETAKSYAAFLAYLALGTRRSVREAARQHHVKATSAKEITGVEDTTVRTWITWSGPAQVGEPWPGSRRMDCPDLG